MSSAHDPPRPVPSIREGDLAALNAHLRYETDILSERDPHLASCVSQDVASLSHTTGSASTPYSLSVPRSATTPYGYAMARPTVRRLSTASSLGDYPMHPSRQASPYRRHHNSVSTPSARHYEELEQAGMDYERTSPGVPHAYYQDARSATVSESKRAPFLSQRLSCSSFSHVVIQRIRER